MVVDPLLKNKNLHFLFSFSGSMCFGVLNAIHIKEIQEQPYFLAAGKPYFSSIL